MDETIGAVTEVTDDDFEAQTSAEGWCLVDFYATWCPHCQAFRPKYEAVAAAQAGPVRFLAADVDQSRQAADGFGITSIPWLVLLRDGGKVEAHLGGMEAGDLTAWLTEHVGG